MTQKRRYTTVNTVPHWMAPGPFARLAKGIVLLICCSFVMMPFLAVIATSLASQQAIDDAGGMVLWPSEVSTAAYQAVLSGGVVTRALMVSIGVTAVGTILSLFTTSLLAYGLSRPGSFAHKPLLLIVLFTLFFSPGIIPMYLLVRQLGLLDTYAALILPVMINGFNVIVMRAFFTEMPNELNESARLDGASDAAIFTRIVLPLSKAPIAVIGLFYAVAYWNSFFTALLYISSTEKWPMQLVLRTFVVQQAPIGVDDVAAGGGTLPPQLSIQMAILVVAIIPILLVYPFIQRHFAKGFMLGSVKG